VQRTCQLERYLRLRYGPVLPDDDAGREDLVIALNHIAHNRTDPGGKMLGFVRRWAPWMPPAEAGDLVDFILKKPRKYTPAKLGELLRLTEEEREIIDSTTIWAFDVAAESMKAKAKQKDREYQKAKRDANRSGRQRGRPKSEGPKPWEAAGYSNPRSYYRHKAKSQSGTKNESEALEENSYAPDGFSVPPAAVISELGRKRRPEPPARPARITEP
jgi:hypothetical protein